MKQPQIQQINHYIDPHAANMNKILNIKNVGGTQYEYSEISSSNKHLDEQLVTQHFAFKI